MPTYDDKGLVAASQSAEASASILREIALDMKSGKVMTTAERNRIASRLERVAKALDQTQEIAVKGAGSSAVYVAQRINADKAKKAGRTSEDGDDGLRSKRRGSIKDKRESRLLGNNENQHPNTTGAVGSGVGSRIANSTVASLKPIGRASGEVARPRPPKVTAPWR